LNGGADFGKTFLQSSSTEDSDESEDKGSDEGSENSDDDDDDDEGEKILYVLPESLTSDLYFNIRKESIGERFPIKFVMVIASPKTSEKNFKTINFDFKILEFADSKCASRGAENSFEDLVSFQKLSYELIHFELLKK